MLVLGILPIIVGCRTRLIRSSLSGHKRYGAPKRFGARQIATFLNLYGNYTKKTNRKHHLDIEHGSTSCPPSKCQCSGNA